MKLQLDQNALRLLYGVLGILFVATVTGWGLAQRKGDGNYRATIKNLNARIGAWWVMAAVFVLALALGTTGAVILFGLISALALREFITLTPTRPGDHRTLFWTFFIITPFQYWLVATDWYGLFT